MRNKTRVGICVAFALLLIALLASACDDAATAADLGCAPYVAGMSGCPGCAPATSAFCGTEQELAQCQYAGSDYCFCKGGRWSCSSQPFPAPPDLSLPRD